MASPDKIKIAKAGVRDLLPTDRVAQAVDLLRIDLKIREAVLAMVNQATREAQAQVGKAETKTVVILMVWAAEATGVAAASKSKAKASMAKVVVSGIKALIAKNGMAFRETEIAQSKVAIPGARVDRITARVPIGTKARDLPGDRGIRAGVILRVPEAKASPADGGKALAIASMVLKASKAIKVRTGATRIATEIEIETKAIAAIALVLAMIPAIMEAAATETETLAVPAAWAEALTLAVV
jgi:hypothetical protein